MTFVLKQGKTKLMMLSVTASTVIAQDALVAWSSGKLIAATSTTAPSSIVGTLVKAIAATDSDYATDSRLVAVRVPVEKYTVWEGTVTSGLVVGDVGGFFDLTSSVAVNRGATTYDVVQCVRVISTTKGLFHLNIGPDAIAGK